MDIGIMLGTLMWKNYRKEHPDLPEELLFALIFKEICEAKNKKRTMKLARTNSKKVKEI